MQSNSSTWGKWVAALLATIALVVALLNMLADNMPKGAPQQVKNYITWDKESIEAVEALPLQDGGRMKPFATYAGFQMLRLHGARSMKLTNEKSEKIKIKPTEWLMDTLFRPDLAVNLPTFRIDNSQVLEAIGISPKGRRDRYSYNEIEPGINKLIELAKTYETIEKKERDPIQQQTIDLAYNLRIYESMLTYFHFARQSIQLVGSGDGITPDKQVDLSAMLTTAPLLRSELQKLQSQGKTPDPNLQGLLQQVLESSNYAKFSLLMLPPASNHQKEWLTCGTAIMDVMTKETPFNETVIEDIKSLENVVRSAVVSQQEFRKAFNHFRISIEKRAAARSEGKYAGMEVSYFKNDYFLNALVLFLLASISALIMWSFSSYRTGKINAWITWVVTSLALAICIYAIIIRCLIMQRPPVGNLYDTIIFIAATGVLLALLIEWMNRQRFALGIAPILGLGLIILARRYEVGDGADHMDPLVAVLDSNFWLATHVITITLGYSAGLLAAILSAGYVMIRGLNLDGKNKDLRRSLTKAVYGTLCLTLFLSLVGTVLGGIWANYSWGRFWGWDPKENGALMIVLWTLAILHARLGGMIKDWGIHLSSLFTACIVAFSWWHVNFLGVGLHNYGFTSGKGTIWMFYAVILAFILLGSLAMLVEYYDKNRSKIQASKDPIKGLEA